MSPLYVRVDFLLMFCCVVFVYLGLFCFCYFCLLLGFFYIALTFNVQNKNLQAPKTNAFKICFPVQHHL